MLSLILPTYNESENLPLLLPKIEKALAGRSFEVIIVDDNSPDRTWETARLLGERQDWLRVIRRVGRRGLSSAVIEGFLAAKGDILAVADADGQHDIGILTGMLDAIEHGNELVVGSRYIAGGSVGTWTGIRYTLSRICTVLTEKLCRVRVKDPMSGFFAMKRETFEKVLPALNPKGFKILLDILIHAPKNTTVTEIPFVFRERLHGKSKLSATVGLEFLEYLYDATAGKYVPSIFLKYCIVGLIGVFVQTSAFALFIILVPALRTVPVLHLPAALPLSIEVAIIANFLFNNFWSFAHVKLRGRKAILGFMRYNIACLLGALVTLAVFSFLHNLGWNTLQSLVGSAFMGTLWNYAMSRMFTWHT